MQARKLSMVQEKGQVTIPADLRRQYGIKKGDVVDFEATEKGILISPREAIAMRALDQISAMLKEKGITLEDLMETGREIRGDLLKEFYGIEVPDTEQQPIK